MPRGKVLAFIALALAVGGAALWNYRIGQVAIPENRTLFVLLFLGAAALGLAALVRGAGWLGGAAAVLAIGIGGLLPATIAISPQQVTADAIRVGDTIPRFTALDGQGDLFDSRSLNGHLVLIKFFRAHW